MFEFMPALLKVVELAASLVRSSAFAEPSLDLDRPEPTDTLPDYVREDVEGLLISHYPDGTLRKENPKSGVIQEERADGSLTVSLPNGLVLHQRHEGESLRALGTSQPARVGYLPVEGQRSLVYLFGEHVVEVSTLRYFRSRRIAPDWRSVAC